MSTIEGMLTHRKHITQYDLYCEYRSTDWWVDLATFMPHLTWLSFCVGEGDDEVDYEDVDYNEDDDDDNKMVETPFALEGLPNLT